MYDETPKTATVIYSKALLRSLEFLLQSAKNSRAELELEAYNTAIVLVSNSFMEAFLNEQLTVYLMAFKEGRAELEDTIQKLKRFGCIQEKWNFLLKGQYAWKSGKAIFSNAEILISLRNEINHFKADLVAPGYTPTKKIKHLIKTIGADKTFPENNYYTEEDMPHWLPVILESTELGEWCINSITNLEGEHSKNIIQLYNDRPSN